MKLICIKDFSAYSIYSKLGYFKSGECYHSGGELYNGAYLMVEDGVGNCYYFYMDDETDENYVYNYFETLEINREKKLKNLKI